MPQSPIPFNAFSSISVDNIVFTGDTSHPHTFQRGHVKTGRHVYLTDRRYTPETLELVRKDGIPPSRPSELPPPGNQHLTLSLGERLGCGRVGTVHAVSVVESDLAARLPKLVVKISRPWRSTSMAEEAWFYEELEQLQGISIARCYGFFQARLQEGERLVVYKRDKLGKWDEWDEWDELENEEEEEEVKDDENEYEGQFPGQGRLVSILVLEKLGGNIPIKVPLDSIEEDVRELFNDLARFSVDSKDIRWSNILSVDDINSGWNKTICPNHGHVHCWRLIDLDRCRKSDGPVSMLDYCNSTWLDRLLENLVWGWVIEPWD